jgi:ubiquinone/menaquinone biosynthesis C-methylase UbiE
MANPREFLAEDRLAEDKVSFGYRQVTSTEKQRLVREQFDPIARTYDLAESIPVFPTPEGLGQKIGSAGFREIRFHRLTNGIAVVYLGVKPEPVS